MKSTTMTDINRILQKINSEGGRVKVEQSGTGGYDLIADRVSPFAGANSIVKPYEVIDKDVVLGQHFSKGEIYEMLIKIRFNPKYRPYLNRGLKRNASRLNMSTPGEKYIGTFEIAKPNGDYDVWEVVRKGRVFVIGTATNSGLLTSYYFKMEQGESEQTALEEINADLEVLADDGPSYMSRVTKIPSRAMEASQRRQDRRRKMGRK